MSVVRVSLRTATDQRRSDVRDTAEFAAWVRPHLAAMAALATRLVGPAERDDVVQEAVTRAWQKLHTFDPGRGTPRAWLCAIVADQARKWRRRAARTRASPMRAPDVGAPDGLRVDVERAIASLPPRMRLAVECYYLADLSVTETAVVMRISEGTVKSTLADARNRMRGLLQEGAE
jgi:DNA-directed RNA polymerase specialized sigma24 family protein